MRLPLTLTVAATFALAAIVSLAAASIAVDRMEAASENGVKAALDKHGLEWTEVYAEGLNVFITGTAPSEADRFMAISTAGTVVDAARVIDNMDVAAAVALAPPTFSVEILRNDAGISLIGLIPEDSDRRAILTRMRTLAGGEDRLSDFMETAQHPVPEGWTKSIRFALNALDYLPRSKISVQSGQVDITAMADSPEDKFRIEGRLADELPTGVTLEMTISAPRPVITPFTLRATLSDNRLQFDACSADTAEARQKILSAVRLIGGTETFECTLGLGVPSPKWADASIVAIEALAKLGSGSVTISDADIALVAVEGTDAALFDRTVAEAEKALPEVFALTATLPVTTEDGETSLPEFSATLSPEGLVQLRGKLGSELSKTTVDSYAQARFGADQLYNATRVADALPAGWLNRVMAAIDALSELHHGAVFVDTDLIEVSGKTGRQDAPVKISQLMTKRLGETERFSLAIAYVEALDPLASIPTPAECITRIQSTQDTAKISFEPGSGTLDVSAMPIIESIAEILKECGEIPLQIQGHTDSQGRESMNLALSQNRAQSVLAALRDRRVLTGLVEAKGFGETTPIATNETEEGREANRRIEFILIEEQGPVLPAQTTSEVEGGTASAQETLENDGDPVNEADAESNQEDTADDQN